MFIRPVDVAWRGTTPRCPLSGCISSVVCRVRFVRLATALMISDGAIPFVGFRQPSCDHSTGFIQCRVQFICMGGSVLTRGEHTPQLSNIALERTT